MFSPEHDLSNPQKRNKMKTNKLPCRKETRLKHYDYRSNGYYFVTICAETREQIFGAIENDEIKLNDAGKMINLWWRKMFEKYNDISMDEYIIMPNHIHGIINIITGEKMGYSGEKMVTGENMVSPLRIFNRYGGLGQYVSWFKRMTTDKYIHHVKNDKWEPFNKRLWQRSYYDHIIRNEESLQKIREYIQNNVTAGSDPVITSDPVGAIPNMQANPCFRPIKIKI